MIERYEQLSYYIYSIYKSIQKIAKEEMEKHGLRGAYAHYLVALCRHPEGLTSARLCEKCDKDKAATSRFVAEMEEKELIYREGGSFSMYKAKLILTPKGKEIADDGAVSSRRQTAQNPRRDRRNLRNDAAHSAPKGRRRQKNRYDQIENAYIFHFSQPFLFLLFSSFTAFLSFRRRACSSSFNNYMFYRLFRQSRIKKTPPRLQESPKPLTIKET